MKKNITQKALVAEYYRKHSSKDIPHKEVVDWAVIEWKNHTGKVFRDPDRAIRSLYQEGYLIKVKKGVYCYNKGFKFKSQENFSIKQKKRIFERDGFKCVICGKGQREGLDLHADHIKPKALGGQAVLSNGQTLCSQHNNFKKSLKQTETGKKMFIRFYEVAKDQGDENLLSFCRDILDIYDKHKMNSHIKWTK